MDCARPHPRAPSDAHWSSVDAADMVARPPSRPRRKRKGAPESPQTEAAIARWSMSPDTRDALPVGSSPLRWGGVLAPSPEKQVGGAARDSSQGSSVRRESLDRTRHNKGAAVRQPYLVADKLKWLDRVHFEQAPPNQTQRKDAELIRRCLERHDKPFVTGPAGIVNGQARGGKLHCTWAQRLRGWLGAEHSLRELSAKQRREKICQQHKPIGAEFKGTELFSSHTIFTVNFEPDPSQQPSRRPSVCNCTVPDMRRKVDISIHHHQLQLHFSPCWPCLST
jgi:hypothetical protein